MGADQRKVVHELAEYYRLESVSEGREAQRFVKVRRTAHSAVPPVMLSQV
jgi:predicted RNA-binding protein Jag